MWSHRRAKQSLVQGERPGSFGQAGETWPVGHRFIYKPLCRAGPATASESAVLVGGGRLGCSSGRQVQAWQSLGSTSRLERRQRLGWPQQVRTREGRWLGASAVQACWRSLQTAKRRWAAATGVDTDGFPQCLDPRAVIRRSGRTRRWSRRRG
jgi:hypothetical protein